MLTTLAHLMATEPWLLILLASILGILVGSFLNVVAYRIPIMLEREWRKECAELTMESPSDIVASDKNFNLVFPNSSCTNCGHKIKPYENIPVLSYVMLGGKCAGCKTKISISYPLFEILACVFSAVVVWKYGFSWQSLAGLGLTWMLIALSHIDYRTHLLPDNMTLPLVWAGVLVNYFGVFTSLESSVIGAVLGYMSLWSLYHLFKILTGKEGMGFGDFKLFAALGAWLGWQSLPLIIVLSSVVGAAYGIAQIIIFRHQRGQPIPFGPFLAVAGWIALIWGTQITEGYLNTL